jgi:hypothetical protein
VEDEAAPKLSAPKKDNVVPVKKAKELGAPAAAGASIEAAVDLFYGKVAGDTDLKPFFDGVDMDKQSFMMPPAPDRRVWRRAGL